MIEIYAGDGKGKTTAAVGMAIRAAGAGLPVLFVQFLKDDSSSEINVLRNVKGIEVLHAPETFGFTYQMTAEQREKTACYCEELLRKVLAYESKMAADTDRQEPVKCIIIMEEVLHALREGFVTEDSLRRLLEQAKVRSEVILTGWDIPDWLEEQADYISRISKVRHPYDRGMEARRGIEY